MFPALLGRDYACGPPRAICRSEWRANEVVVIGGRRRLGNQPDESVIPAVHGHSLQPPTSGGSYESIGQTFWPRKYHRDLH